MIDTPEVPEFLTLKEVTRRVRLSAPSVYRHVKDGTFPRPVKFGAKALWLRAELDSYVCARMAARDGGANAPA